MLEGPCTAQSVNSTGPSSATDARPLVPSKEGVGRLLRLGSVLALAVVALMLAPAGASTAPPRPDLVVSSLSARGSLVSGRSVTVTITTRNAGQRRAGASRTRLYLSRDRSLSSLDKLLGGVSVPALSPGQSVLRRIAVTVPATSPPAGELLACADGGRAVAEASEANNCRSMPDGDRDGWANFTDCAPTNPGVNPGVSDKPDVPNFRDTNCDGIDGNARRAVFVSPVGDDASPGGRAAPKETLRAAVDTAAAQGKDVYATLGNNYSGVLNMRNGVGVYGGYDTAWKRSLSNSTRITGAVVGSRSEGAVAADITSPTALQHLTLAPPPPGTPGGNSYGLRALRSGGLTVERVVASAAAGRGGTPGADGTRGQPGGEAGGYRNTGGGATSWGRNGGNGGIEGSAYSGHESGHAGGAGYLRAPGDAHGRMGGEGGNGGPDSGNGGPGSNGDSGVRGADGAGGSGGVGLSSGLWSTRSGQAGANGTHGHGGGGGGGGGAIGLFEDPGGRGGGGGGGGQAGGGGRPGSGGGGSFGIFLLDSSGAVVRDSTITAANGGPGGRGGIGGYPGAGGSGGPGITESSTWDESIGGKGGLGGPGGLGGGGGGGAGGPSIALFASNSIVTDSRNTLTHGTGGAGGFGGGGTGASGQAADRN